MSADRPLCLNCGKPLRKCAAHKTYPDSFPSPWGGYGDGHFCGLNCGYRWAVMHLRRNPKYAANLHAAMLRVMAAAKVRR